MRSADTVGSDGIRMLLEPTAPRTALTVDKTDSLLFESLGKGRPYTLLCVASGPGCAKSVEETELKEQNVLVHWPDRVTLPNLYFLK